MNILEGDHVRVYWNLHKNCYSVQTKQWRPSRTAKSGSARAWRVTAHVEKVYLDEPRFTVSAAGNARVRREQRKNVHAYVTGYWTGGFGGGVPAFAVRDMFPVAYNPYRHTEFQDTLLDKPIHHARRAFLATDRKIWAWQ